MRTIVYASFPSHRDAEHAARAMGASGFLPVASSDLRTQCADAGERLGIHPVAVTTGRAELAADYLRELGADRIRTIPDARNLSDDPEPVDQAGRESFPASDPPAWTM